MCGGLSAMMGMIRYCGCLSQALQKKANDCTVRHYFARVFAIDDHLV